MGLKPLEVNTLLFKEWHLMFLGYQDRQNREWNRTRHLMSYIASYAGMGARDFVHPKNIWPLPFDREDQKKYIKTLKQCLDLINEFEVSINGSEIRS